MRGNINLKRNVSFYNKVDDLNPEMPIINKPIDLSKVSSHKLP
jgi:hypothetical protein